MQREREREKIDEEMEKKGDQKKNQKRPYADAKHTYYDRLAMWSTFQ